DNDVVHVPSRAAIRIRPGGAEARIRDGRVRSAPVVESAAEDGAASASAGRAGGVVADTAPPDRQLGATLEDACAADAATAARRPAVGTRHVSVDRGADERQLAPSVPQTTGGHDAAAARPVAKSAGGVAADARAGERESASVMDEPAAVHDAAR